MLGELLLDQKRPADALHEFETSLRQEPNRFWSLYGAAEAARQAGDAHRARQYFAALLAITPRADRPERAQLIDARRALKDQ
jgi:tetratricopeptide (TPR) repeat protein